MTLGIGQVTLGADKPVAPVPPQPCTAQTPAPAVPWVHPQHPTPGRGSGSSPGLARASPGSLRDCPSPGMCQPCLEPGMSPGSCRGSSSVTLLPRRARPLLPAKSAPGSLDKSDFKRTGFFFPADFGWTGLNPPSLPSQQPLLHTSSPRAGSPRPMSHPGGCSGAHPPPNPLIP